MLLSSKVRMLLLIVGCSGHPLGGKPSSPDEGNNVDLVSGQSREAVTSVLIGDFELDRLWRADRIGPSTEVSTKY